ncbi:MAG: NAD(P)H-binding protein [Lactobacillaceae bacterium]|jgi:putative NADH-flavin reductase|nr:NAD(P)H-binding protein [Lactobacillaceae bacterium]
MKIGIIGANGNAGSALVAEALKRSDQVVAFVRDAKRTYQMFGTNDSIEVIEKDVFDINEHDLKDLDALVDTYRAAPGQENYHVKLAEHLTNLAKGTDLLELFILGSSTLRNPDGSVMADELPGHENDAPWIPGAIAQGKELDFLRTVKDVNWIGFSPQQAFYPGPASGYKIGKDDLMISLRTGQSSISTGNAAMAILDQLHKPEFIKDRFTASDV